MLFEIIIYSSECTLINCYIQQTGATQDNTSSSSGSPSEEQLAEAEHLKTDGKNITPLTFQGTSHGPLTESVHVCSFRQQSDEGREL